MCLNYTCIIFIFLICACTCSTCSFVVFASAAVAHGIIVLLKKSISYFMNIMYKRIFLNFGVISLLNKEMVSLFQLHTYKFGLVYICLAQVHNTAPRVRIEPRSLAPESEALTTRPLRSPYIV